MTAPARSKTAKTAQRTERAERAEDTARRTDGETSGGTRRRDTASRASSARTSSTRTSARAAGSTAAKPASGTRRAEREAATARVAERTRRRRTGEATGTSRTRATKPPTPSAKPAARTATAKPTTKPAARTATAKPTTKSATRTATARTATAKPAAKSATRTAATARTATKSPARGPRTASAGTSTKVWASVEAPVRTAPATERSAPRPERQRRSSSAAGQRAFARRAHREGARPEPLDDEEPASGRASFVVLIIALLTVGVVATLWLSTQAIADSYRLEEAKTRAGELAERAAELQRDVTRAESPSELAKRAKEMGMVPAGDPARLVVMPDGRVVVVGEPTPAEKPAPPADDRQDTGSATPGDG